MINLGGGSAEQWLAWARRKALEAAASVDGLPPARPEPQAALTQTPAEPEPGTAQEPALEGVILDPVAARKRARDEAFRAHPDAIMMRAISSR